MCPIKIQHQKVRETIAHLCHYLFIFWPQIWNKLVGVPLKVNGVSFLKQVLGELPEQFFLMIVYGVPTYWLANLRPEPECFFLMLLLLMLVTFCARTMAMWMSAMLPTFHISAFVANILYTMFLMSGGFFISLENLWTGKLETPGTRQAESYMHRSRQSNGMPYFTGGKPFKHLYVFPQISEGRPVSGSFLVFHCLLYSVGSHPE